MPDWLKKYLPVRKSVFWPPVLLLVFSLGLSTFYQDVFLGQIKEIQSWILHNFSLPISYLSLIMVALIIWVLFSPLGNYKIGGPKAKPRLHFFSWFAIVLCTTIAVGILFWGSAEPLSHFLSPPKYLNSESGSEKSKIFALGALYFHWGITPYSIYAVPALLFGLIYYAKKNRFRLSLMLTPLYPVRSNSIGSKLVDMVSLFALVTGMAASLGAGILSLASAVRGSFPEANFQWLTLLVMGLIVATFVVSASTGIDRGIRRLSLFNLWFFALFALLFIYISWDLQPLSNILPGLKTYASWFPDLSLQLSGKGAQWTFDWTTFNLAVWMAWAPITALFLGKIAIGRTVREFILVNLFLPASFCVAWMGIFGGTTLELAANDPQSYRTALQSLGPESIIYQVFGDLDHLKAFSIFFGIGMFISYVTAADSSTEAMASLSMKGKVEDEFQVNSGLKIFWGILLGLISWVMINYSGIEGVRILSVIGGLPAFFFLSLASISLFILSLKPNKFL